MEPAIVYAIVSFLIGILLVFFGLRLMKVTVAIIGAVIGYGVVYALASSAGWSDALAISVAAISGLVLGGVAFAFYKFAVMVSIAFFFANLVYVALLAADQSSTLSLVIAGVVAIVAFLVVRALKVVDALFAFVTASQGALLIVAGIYVLIYPFMLDKIQTSSLEVILRSEIWWPIAWIVIIAVGFLWQIGAMSKKELTAAE